MSREISFQSLKIGIPEILFLREYSLSHDIHVHFVEGCTVVTNKIKSFIVSIVFPPLEFILRHFRHY